ncbi:hypothetical protein AB1Y20_016048 [Prymnesium parvum]|eukprot:CAMPEP_0182807112 /NCGR_PEP_ID=MMETSP0006_2-20121128/5960_1 /TAXON_ID=97485 /ORGANISM="Prymnesium parvum, Strain Texoma1" /LENGTH=320 /DNA_ID=CAMNT_0024932775 /DNA_START=213 /DNA_END=1175 /DNA_ORIENTATION=+
MMLPTAFAAVPSEVSKLMSLLQQTRPPGALSCDPRLAREVARTCADLEASAPKARPDFPRDLMLVDGRWSLLYTSSGTSILEALPEAVLPPDLPEPLSSALSGALDGSPLQPRQVTQVIDVMGRRITNSVTLAPWPSGGLSDFMASAPGPLGAAMAQLKKAQVTLDLDHHFYVDGDGSRGGPRRAVGTSTIRLELETIRRSLGPLEDGAFGGLIPKESQYSIPPPLRAAVSGSFDTIYVDDKLRVCRGGDLGGALRIFERQDVVGVESEEGRSTESEQLDPWTGEPVPDAVAKGLDDDVDVEELWDEESGQWIISDAPSD